MPTDDPHDFSTYHLDTEGMYRQAVFDLGSVIGDVESYETGGIQRVCRGGGNLWSSLAGDDTYLGRIKVAFGYDPNHDREVVDSASVARFVGGMADHLEMVYGTILDSAPDSIVRSLLAPLSSHRLRFANVAQLFERSSSFDTYSFFEAEADKAMRLLVRDKDRLDGLVGSLQIEADLIARSKRQQHDDGLAEPVPGWVAKVFNGFNRQNRGKLIEHLFRRTQLSFSEIRKCVYGSRSDANPDDRAIKVFIDRTNSQLKTPEAIAEAGSLYQIAVSDDLIATLEDVKPITESAHPFTRIA